jgi:hypothetical protein
MPLSLSCWVEGETFRVVVKGKTSMFETVGERTGLRKRYLLVTSPVFDLEGEVGDDGGLLSVSRAVSTLPS